MNTKLFPLFLIISLLISCNESRKTKSAEWINRYNSEIIEGENKNQIWVESPLMIAARLCRAGEVSKKTDLKLIQLNQGERPMDVEVFINQSGVLDHENPNSSNYFHLKRINEKWRVIN